MSFETLRLNVLRDIISELVGEEEAKSVKNKPEAVALLAEEGVTWEQYETLKSLEPADPEPAAVQAASARQRQQQESDVLVKMDRNNFRFDIRGYTFTKEHPFVVMPEEEADAIFESTDGFRLATGKEAKEFYS